MVRKEVGMHLLAYNLIRGVMAEAARGRDVQPRTNDIAVHSILMPRWEG